MASKKKARTRRPARAAGGKNDATVLLKRDHLEVRKLFKQFEKLAEQGSRKSQRESLAKKICLMLGVHTTIEEEIFYPAAREAGVAEDLLDEAQVEHASAKDLIAQILAADDEELYDAKVKVLGEYVNHHVQEEEEELFPKCRRSDMDLAELGSRLEARKSELMKEDAATVLQSVVASARQSMPSQSMQ